MPTRLTHQSKKQTKTTKTYRQHISWRCLWEFLTVPALPLCNVKPSMKAWSFLKLAFLSQLHRWTTPCNEDDDLCGTRLVDTSYCWSNAPFRMLSDARLVHGLLAHGHVCSFFVALLSPKVQISGTILSSLGSGPGPCLSTWAHKGHYGHIRTLKGFIGSKKDLC